MGKLREENHNWKGGRFIASNGYVLVRVGTAHHLSDVRGYAYEHRIVAERKLGRQLEIGEQVHHRNGNKTDNRPENLEVMESMAHHRQAHRKPNSKKKCIGEANPIIQCACGCVQWLNKFGAINMPRTFISGHNPPDRSKQEEFITAFGEGSRLESVASKTGQSIQACKCMASKLVAEGKLTRKGRGIYGRSNAHRVD